MKRDETWASIAMELDGNEMTDDEIARKYDLTPEEKIDIESELENEGLERCAVCNKWSVEIEDEHCPECEEIEDEEDEDE